MPNMERVDWIRPESLGRVWSPRTSQQSLTGKDAAGGQSCSLHHTWLLLRVPKSRHGAQYTEHNTREGGTHLLLLFWLPHLLAH